MKSNNPYLSKHSFTAQLIAEPPSDNLALVVVIPCYNEPNLIASLQSLKKCELPSSDVEVIVLINSAENESGEVLEQNRESFHQAKEWAELNSLNGLRFFILNQTGLPKKHAGVGLARKIGMDEAVRRFEQAGNPNGIIVCFDADSLCDTNYLVELEKHFRKNPKTPACSIYFEHPLEGTEFSKEVYDGIANYELHLRYYVNALKYAAYPYAFQTIGSSLAVRSDVYQKQGGMNRRKAGEDFYFLSKVMHLGNFSELNSARVIPSPRSSHRVPFGTGKAIGDWLKNGSTELPSYNLQIFEDMKTFIALVPEFYAIDEKSLKNLLTILPESVTSFLEANNFMAKLKEVQNHSASQSRFIKRFFRWFDNFMVLKFVHYVRDNFYPNVEITEAASGLLRKMKLKDESRVAKSMLLFYRKMDRH